MAEADDQVLWEAEFNPKVRTYWLLGGIGLLLVTVVGIAILPIWLILGHYFTGRYLSHMKCVLKTGTLEYSRGLFVRVEKTVPLDKITDLGLVHGPIMRHFDLQALSIETAGQSSTGAVVKLIGVVDTEAFRAAVLAQRDKVLASLSGGEKTPPGSTLDPSSQTLLTEIRDALHRIEGRMDERSGG